MTTSKPQDQAIALDPKYATAFIGRANALSDKREWGKALADYSTAIALDPNYAAAYGKDPEFFAFTRSLTSYEKALQGSNSSMVVSPDSAFFDYLNSPNPPEAKPPAP